MTISMFTSEEKADLVQFATHTFAFLHEEYSFALPTIDDDDWSATNVGFLSKDIAVEVTLDWRERDVFVLLVRLEKGEMPERGYVSSSGKVIRIHALGVVEREECTADQAVQARSRILAREKKRLEQRTVEFMKSQLEDNSQLLRACMDTILQSSIKESFRKSDALR